MKTYLFTVITTEYGETKTTKVPARGEDIDDAKQSLAVIFLTAYAFGCGGSEDESRFRFTDPKNTKLEATDEDGNEFTLTITDVKEFGLLY